ncbi:hypothetical protein GBL_0136 [Geobacillus kaustophilus GBlys]|uniref:Uncharacterized protein n=2 Tax=Geobacillus TaxID=129337 RepID=A0A1Q5T457_9BACL|nr:hypothetical protein BRO54_1208 [Geobacillus proteiniphilus]GAD11919.1 hypothetical protein GBL_0136 [Geobacillus kaustophilus GBlys]
MLFLNCKTIQRFFHLKATSSRNGGFFTDLIGNEGQGVWLLALLV